MSFGSLSLLVLFYTSSTIYCFYLHIHDTMHLVFFDFLFLKIILFLAALGLHCCVRAFLSCGERGLLFIAVHELLFAEHRLWVHLLQQLQLAGSREWAQWLWYIMWNLPRPEIKSMSPALVSGFLSTMSPGKS